jgi:RNA polymerase-interacting CarD/CdnL/TRCF family regulator
VVLLKKKNGVSKLRIGSRVFHPAHGVVTVLGIEQREMGPSTLDFYVLGLPRGGTLLLPVGNVGQANVRDLVSAAKARELMERVRTAAPTTRTKVAWRERAATYKDGMRSGSADRYTEILSELLFRARAEKLSAGDQQVLDMAHGHFIGEIGAVLDRSPVEIEAGLGESGRS